jgi:hypothetical protein
LLNIDIDHQVIFTMGAEIAGDVESVRVRILGDREPVRSQFRTFPIQRKHAPTSTGKC